MITPFAFAFTAGMVATVNPCGFAMLPAYVSLFLTDGGDGRERAGLAGGLRVGAWVTVGFVIMFSLAGVVISFVSRQVLDLIPWAALIVGVGLVGLGIAVLAGFHLTTRPGNIRFAKKGSPGSMAVFGIAYGTASIACTLPVFLAVTTQVFAASNPLTGAVVFTGYGLGMGAVLMALAAALATSRGTLLRRLRRFMPFVERIGGWMLVAAGLYIVYYWVVNLTLTPGSDNFWLEPIRFVDRISARLTSSIGADPLLWFMGLIIIVATIWVFEVRRAQRQAVEAHR